MRAQIKFLESLCLEGLLVGSYCTAMADYFHRLPWQSFKWLNYARADFYITDLRPKLAVLAEKVQAFRKSVDHNAEKMLLRVNLEFSSKKDPEGSRLVVLIKTLCKQQKVVEDAIGNLSIAARKVELAPIREHLLTHISITLKKNICQQYKKRASLVLGVLVNALITRVRD